MRTFITLESTKPDNGHTFSNKLRFPRAREVHVYIGDVWQAITQAIGGQPIAVWFLGGGSEMALDINQFVLQDGRTFKTKQMLDMLVQACADLGNEDLANKVFSINHAASIIAREKNNWKPTPASILETVQMACVEHGHGGLWNGEYDVNDVICIDMKSCYPASLKGLGEAEPYFKKFGHPRSRMAMWP